MLTELLQNALQHGLAHPPGAAPAGTLKVTVDRAPDGLTVTVEDSGVGLPEGFRLDAATSLGLQIVRTLVVSELGGRLEISPRAGGGTAVLVALPLEALRLTAPASHRAIQPWPGRPVCRQRACSPGTITTGQWA